MKTQSILAASAFVASTIAATISNPKTPPVTTKNNAFYAGGKRFYIRGVDYQPGGASLAADPIADVAGCTRDVAYFKDLGINTIRVYTIDNSANHDACMKLLADAGIYLALDVNTPVYSLNRQDEAAIKRSYNEVYLQSVFATVEAFAKYDNTLLFYSANEVINDDKTTFAAPYIKALTRDIRGYIKARGLRSIPVGYSAADVTENRYQTAQYLNCGSDDVRSDFFAFNDYSWCSPSSFTTSGWDQKVELFRNYSLPIFLSEYGCNTNKRDFSENTALFSNQMTAVYSGGLVYEYSQEESKYGLLQLTGGNGVSKFDDYDALKKANAATPLPTGDGGAQTSKGPAAPCPAFNSVSWLVNTTQLPALPAKAQAYFTGGAGTGPGLSNKAGSQNAGTASTGFSSNSGVPAGSGSSNSGSGGNSTTTGAAANVQIGAYTMVLAGSFALTALYL